MARVETDQLGSITIEDGCYWGPQTERARLLFQIGREYFPPALIRAIGLQKQAAARANLALGELPPEIAAPIIAIAAAIAAGEHNGQFPLPVWQTGSGTQTNMNANEVIANLANQSLGQKLGARAPVHPNDHVNRGQSSNDSFPTMMHIAAVEECVGLAKALMLLKNALTARADAFAGLIKIGRTHMMDAVPVTLGQEFGAWARQVELGLQRLESVRERLLAVPQGGTAVGTGLNTNRDFDTKFCAELATLTGLPFTPNPNKFEGMGAHDAFVELSGMLNTIAVSLNKLGNDIRLLGSGPRAGLAELIIPEDGLSSSIMPGKTNPTQSEALTMICAQVMGNHVAVTVGAAQSFLELNVFKPLIIHNVLQSLRLLRDGAESFARNMVDKLQPNQAHIAENLAKSLMLVTALNPHIGYDKAVQIGKKALRDNITLREAGMALGFVTGEDFDRWVQPEAMLHPGAVLA